MPAWRTTVAGWRPDSVTREQQDSSLVCLPGRHRFAARDWSAPLIAGVMACPLDSMNFVRERCIRTKLGPRQCASQLYFWISSWASVARASTRAPPYERPSCEGAMAEKMGDNARRQCCKAFCTDLAKAPRGFCRDRARRDTAAYRGAHGAADFEKGVCVAQIGLACSTDVVRSS
jgi:hypothetical protein